MPADANATPVTCTAGPPHKATPPNILFPIFLKLESMRVLLVGGGSVALQQLGAILSNSPAAAVTVVAPDILPALRELADQHTSVQLHQRPFQDADLDGHDLLFLATNDPALHRYIGAAAVQRHLLTHVADAPDLCSFCLPAVVPTEDDRVARYPNRTLAYETPATAYWRRVATGALATFALFIFINILSYYFTWQQAWDLARSSSTFYTFVAVGFVAQLIDGMLGMGYGVVSAISLMSLGLSPVSVSASIHTAEMFASGASGYQHYRFGNVNKKLFRVLLLPGIAGSIGGAYLLSRFGEEYANWVKPLLAAYLLVLGLRILSKALRPQRDKRRKVKNAGWLAGVGGFLDSFGGGGWGPLVTSTLITTGRTPRYVIGTVSLVEFFVTFASAFTFFAMKGLSHWQIVAGLIVGGVAAAPLAARLAGRIPTRWMFVGVGLMVIVWSLWALRKVVF
ncbi:TSUP family transporter [Hymenobacter properus]|uniref:Probable membrane transporter protein n=1 Tax=Hymenobacter properus TaxID=2791026 RepID=A0A931BEY9_9BACT|nr:TSUP family transporter [Hymenobacter properus]MBF9140092.1 TSUP family transporter [Hymenobacter properus]MBR7718899.1 TSUP family transporter [Microvirga sp. SRT04]